MFFRRQHLHFTGIGGIGMSGIAEVLLNLGYTISGSDLKLTPITERLSALGAAIHEGHAASNVSGARALVVSSAVDELNPEVQEARRLQIPVIPRGELLAELMRLKFGIAIAGSHGKTTTTSLTATILNHAGLDPTVMVGGRVATMGGSNARVGHSDFLVVESDESDGSFLKLAPILAIVTNIDREHLDHYASLDEIRAAFIEFVNKVPFYGAAIVCVDDDNVKAILPAVRRRTITYGASTQADLEAIDIRCGPFASDFSLRHRQTDLGRFHLRIPGRHNVLNATAAAAVALELEVAPDRIREGLASFSGVDRRFQTRGQERGITVIDDYGHHPTEIRATLAAARLCGFRRVHVLFQPHRYTRTFHLLDEFGGAFHEADTVLILDIYAASEQPIEGVNAETLAGRIRQFGHRGVDYVGTIERGVAALLAVAEEGDLVLTLGAGNVWQAGDLVLAGLKQIQREAEVHEMPREKARPPFRWRLWLAIVAWSAVFISSAMAAREVHRYVVTDAKFILSADDRSALTIQGVSYAARAKLLRVFALDYGRSIFAVPLDERRRRLLAVDWVEDAAVSRIWPNRLLVRITERRPVAFVSLPLHGASGSAARFLLVDAQGVLLDPPSRAQFAFPVLTGLSDDQTDAERRVRVRAMQGLMDDLGPAGQNISEINAAAPDDLTVVAQVEGRPLELKLGDGNYAKRLQSFLLHYPEIRKRAVNVTTFDLRLDDRITAKEPPNQQ